MTTGFHSLFISFFSLYHSVLCDSHVDFSSIEAFCEQLDQCLDSCAWRFTVLFVYCLFVFFLSGRHLIPVGDSFV